jgi:hypothetical protein
VDERTKREMKIIHEIKEAETFEEVERILKEELEVGFLG